VKETWRLSVKKMNGDAELEGDIIEKLRERQILNMATCLDHGDVTDPTSKSLRDHRPSLIHVSTSSHASRCPSHGDRSMHGNSRI
jgi:hypothetical protein